MDNLFGIGFPELILILVIAGIVMGPERIGTVARWLGKTTAQLQSISRMFVRQLQNELDGVDDGDAIREAMHEVQTLRKELEQMRGDFVRTTSSAAAQGKYAMREAERSIQPPKLAEKNAKISQQAEEAEDTAVPSSSPPTNVNGSTVRPSQKPDLPNLLNVPDDPES